MVLHQAAYLDYNLYRAGYPGHMRQDWIIERWEQDGVNSHIQVAYWQFSECCTPSLSPGGTDGVPGRDGVGSGVGYLCQSGGGAPIPLHLQRVYGFFEVPFWQGRHPFMWFWRSIAGCLSIAAFTCLCLGNLNPRCFSSQTLARRLLIRYCVSSIVAHENHPLAMLAIFKARCMSDCSSWTRPPCLVLVADTLKTYKILVAGSNNEIWLLAYSYILR